MDLSKLPRMSKTPPPPPPQAAEQARLEPLAPQPRDASIPDYAGPRPRQVLVEAGTGAEVWLSLILGFICLLLGMRFARWMIVTASGGTFQTGVNWTAGPKAGQPVEYFELTGYPAYTDMAFFIFGLALVLEAVAILMTNSAHHAFRRVTALVALMVTATATLFNAGLAAVLASLGQVPIVSLLMVAFGGYMTVYLYRLWSALRSADERAFASG